MYDRLFRMFGAQLAPDSSIATVVFKRNSRNTDVKEITPPTQGWKAGRHNVSGIPENPRLLQQRQSRCLPAGQELRPCASSLYDLRVCGNEVVLGVESQHVAGGLVQKKERAPDQRWDEVKYIYPCFRQVNWDPSHG
jgi:hypothetical protein